MAITFGLVHASPYRLRYLVYQDGEQGVMGNLPNDGGVSPDLRTDAASAPPISGAGGIPILKIMRARLDGFGPIAAGALTQAQARALGNSEDNPAAPAVLTNDLIGRCVTRITAMDVAMAWSADWNIDGEGDPICQVQAESDNGGYALLDIHFRHTKDL